MGRSDTSDIQDANSVASKIDAWKCIPLLIRLMIGLKIENPIARPDGLGTGNVHRSGLFIHLHMFDNRSQLSSQICIIPTCAINPSSAQANLALLFAPYKLY